MKVVYGVSQKGDVICIVQICEMIFAQWEADGRDNTFHDPINCTAEQSRSENATPSDMWRGDETGTLHCSDPDTGGAATVYVFY